MALALPLCLDSRVALPFGMLCAIRSDVAGWWGKGGTSWAGCSCGEGMGSGREGGWVRCVGDR